MKVRYVVPFFPGVVVLLMGANGSRIDGSHRLSDAELGGISGSETKRCELDDWTNYQVFDGNVGCDRCADALQGNYDICIDYTPYFYNLELLGGGASFTIYETCTDQPEDGGTRCEEYEDVTIYFILQCDGGGAVTRRLCNASNGECDIYYPTRWCEECYVVDILHEEIKTIFECEKADAD